MTNGRITSIVLKVAGLCNLNCGYCYLYQHGDSSYLRRPKFITDRVFKQFLLNARDYCDRHAPHALSITFHGGEPTLIGTEWIDEAAARAREILGKRLSRLIIQTNAILLNEQWVNIFRRRDIHASISLDGPETVHDRSRVNHAGRGSYTATVRGLQLLRGGGVNPNILCVIDPSSSGLEVYRHFRSLGIDRMNFLLPDVSHDNRDRLYGHFGASPVADYLIPIFDDWFNEDEPSIWIGIFRELIGMIRGGRPRSDAFGNPRMGYLIVETDGSIHANDVLRVCGYDISNSGLNIFEHSFNSLHQGAPLLYKLVHEGIGLCATCEACPERLVCGGGHLPHRYANRNGFDNPSVWCADILKLLAHIRHRLQLVRYV